MKLSAPREGERIAVNGKAVSYTFWPTRVGPKGNASLQSLLFSLDPWAIIDLSIKSSCPANALKEALACMAQAKDFYDSAIESGRFSAKPLSLYYCLMNLVKAFCLTRGTRSTFDKAQHGLSETLRQPGNKELTDAYLKAFPSPSSRGELQNFSEFMNALSGSQLSGQQDLDLPFLLPQIVSGHRLWSVAATKRERFVALHEIRPMCNKTTKEMWLNLYFVADDIFRARINRKDLLSQAGLTGKVDEVSCSEPSREGRRLICFQQVQPAISSTAKLANHLQTLFDGFKQNLWTTVLAVPPYRQYYVYLRPPAEASQVVHQLLSIYAIAYYLGSITRYRPHHFPLITDSAFGPMVQDYIASTPLQFLYLMASEFARRDIARPSTV